MTQILKYVTERGFPASKENIEISCSLDMVYYYYYHRNYHNSTSDKIYSLQMKFLFRSCSSCLKAKILELMSIFADEKENH
jgi:hypothetical protein